MTGGSIGTEAVGAASLRQLASEWGGPRPAGAGSRAGSGRGPVRREQRTLTPRR